MRKAELRTKRLDKLKMGLGINPHKSTIPPFAYVRGFSIIEILYHLIKSQYQKRYLLHPHKQMLW